MPAQSLPRSLARLAAAHKDALHARSGQETAQIFRRDEIGGAIFFLKSKAALAVHYCTVASQVDDMRLELVYLLFQLLKGAQVTRVEGYVLTRNGPKHSLLFTL